MACRRRVFVRVSTVLHQRPFSLFPLRFPRFRRPTTRWHGSQPCLLNVYGAATTAVEDRELLLIEVMSIR